MDQIIRGPLRECIKSKLLTDEDSQFLEEKLNEKQRFRSLLGLVVPFVALALAIYNIGGHCEYNGYKSTSFALKCVFNVYIVFGLYVSHLLWLPYIVRFCTWQFHRVDYRFHKFIANVRQTESGLYGIKHMIGDQSSIHRRSARIDCVCQLRRLIAVAQDFGVAFSTDYPPVVEFLTDELRELSSEETEIVDEYLDLNALTALWQFYYVQRSETLRNYALCHFESCQQALTIGSWWSFLKFARASLLEFIKFAWFSTRFDVPLENVKSPQKTERKIQMKQMSELKSIKVQLEYALERLHQTQLQSSNDRKMLSELLMDIANRLKVVPKDSRTQLQQEPPIHSTEMNREESIGELSSAEDEHEPEYQVFEATADEVIQETSEDDQLNDPLTPPPIPHRDLQAELHLALSSRRERDFEMQARALAKSRREPIEKIREELKAEMHRPKERQMEVEPKPKLVPFNVNSTVRVDKNELVNALRNRFNNVRPIETFGDSSSDDEN